MKTHKFRYTTLALLFGALLILGSCKKEVLPKEVIDTPDFYLEGSIENEALDIAGGIDNYYMFTSYHKDEKDVLTFSGNLAKVNCQGCSGDLGIEIRDYQKSEEIGGLVDPSRSLKTGDYSFRYIKGEGQVFRIAFSADEESSGNQSYFWDFGDGTTSTDPNPQHDFLNDGTIYEVCLKVIAANNESTEICNELSLNQNECIADFSHELRAEYGNYVEFRSESRGIEPVRYLWEFGDGVMATLNNPGYYYPDDSLYTACLTIVDEHGCVSTLCKNIATEPDVPEGNFSYEVESITIPPDSLALSRVSITWRDQDNNLYSSDRKPQPPSSQFTILSSENYEVNEKGEKTQRLKVKFSCRVFFDDQFMDLKDVEGYIGVAYP